MCEKYLRARDKYRPHVEYLLIAESPPESGGYFYFERMTKNDHLFRETMKALGIYPEYQTMTRAIDKAPLLKEFQSRGFFLIDVSYKPIDKAGIDERRKAVREGIPNLLNEVRGLNPRNIIIVKKTIFNDVRFALQESRLGDRILNKGPLPFPSNGNQARYRTMLKDLLKNIPAH